MTIASRGIILSRQRTTKALIRLHGCTGWSAHLLFAYGIRQVFSWRGTLYHKIGMLPLLIKHSSTTLPGLPLNFHFKIPWHFVVFHTKLTTLSAPLKRRFQAFLFILWWNFYTGLKELATNITELHSVTPPNNLFIFIRFQKYTLMIQLLAKDIQYVDLQTWAAEQENLCPEVCTQVDKNQSA